MQGIRSLSPARNGPCFDYPSRVLSTSLALALFVSLTPPSIPALGQTTPKTIAPKREKSYPLHNWKNITCRAKGRFQDRGYCDSAVIDQIVADGKSAIPILISQITDSRWIAEPVYDFWPRIRTGELAYFILGNLFVDDTWQCLRYSLLKTAVAMNPRGFAGGSFGKHIR